MLSVNQGQRPPYKARLAVGQMPYPGDKAQSRLPKLNSAP
jgi:hypothetical protein